jgi:hypothetical protein
LTAVKAERKPAGAHHQSKVFDLRRVLARHGSNDLGMDGEELERVDPLGQG